MLDRFLFYTELPFSAPHAPSFPVKISLLLFSQLNLFLDDHALRVGETNEFSNSATFPLCIFSFIFCLHKELSSGPK